jgi:hypothetical protein
MRELYLSCGRILQRGMEEFIFRGFGSAWVGGEEWIRDLPEHHLAVSVLVQDDLFQILRFVRSARGGFVHAPSFWLRLGPLEGFVQDLVHHLRVHATFSSLHDLPDQ